MSLARSTKARYEICLSERFLHPSGSGFPACSKNLWVWSSRTCYPSLLRCLLVVKYHCLLGVALRGAKDELFSDAASSVCVSSTPGI